jgi:type IV pilus assembly protein PilA
MIDRLRQRSSDEGGFTLIELLVVILIIGILAAIAIPTFLNQKSKAYDASAKELARTAQTTAETYSTDHSGEFKWGANGLAELKNYETGLPGCPNSNGACLSSATELESGKGYEIKVIAQSTGDEFIIKRNGSAEVTRECKSSNKGCAGGASSSW